MTFYAPRLLTVLYVLTVVTGFLAAAVASAPVMAAAWPVAILTTLGGGAIVWCFARIVFEVVVAFFQIHAAVVRKP